MIYTNVPLAVETRNGKHGVFFNSCAGFGRDVFLPVSDEILYDINGFKRNLNIEIIEGIPTIVTRMSIDFYLILAVNHCLDSAMVGILGYPRSQKTEFIGENYFRSLGSEKLFIIRSKDQNIFRITWGDGDYNSSSNYYFVKNKRVDVTTEREGAEKLYEKHGLEMPFRYKTCCYNCRRIDLSEWSFK